GGGAAGACGAGGGGGGRGAARAGRGARVAAGLGPAATYAPHDVTSEEQWRALVLRVLTRDGRIDVLVNNAAILHIGCIENTPPETARRVLEVNVLGPFLGLRAVVGAMRARRSG